jgi:hypothetical protein
MNRHTRQRRAAAAGIAGLLALSAAAPAAPDLRLEWLDAGSGTRDMGPVTGRAGETVRVPYQIRNVGGSAAFAIIVAAHTTLGPLGRPERLQPGPKAGEDMSRSLVLPLARGVREVCLDVRLQTRNVDDAQDRNPSDNGLCRRVEVSSE